MCCTVVQGLTKLLIFLPGNVLLLFLPSTIYIEAIMYHKRQVEAKQWHLRNYFSPDITKTESKSLFDRTRERE